MASPKSNSNIMHQPERRRFIFDVSSGKGVLAYIEYAVVNGRSGQALDLQHTYVPPEGRGCGAAAEITKAAFNYAKQENMSVIPTCSYVSETFLARHPEYQNQVVPSSQL